MADADTQLLRDRPFEAGQVGRRTCARTAIR